MFCAFDIIYDAEVQDEFRGVSEEDPEQPTLLPAEYGFHEAVVLAVVQVGLKEVISLHLIFVRK